MRDHPDYMDRVDATHAAYRNGTPIPPVMYGDQADTPAADPSAAGSLTALTLSELLQRYPKMREPVIDGVLRVGEIANVIAPPKFGKSWLVLWLVLAVATGRPWLGYATTKGRVLLIDNELHSETLASRLRRVAQAYGVPLEDITDQITVLPLRGQLQDIRQLGDYLRSLEPGAYKLVVIDAFYRALPSGTEENDNGAMAGLYNLLDSYADHLGACIVLIHHSSKGNQAEKAVTDVGSGAGSQSRAADAHLILRPHAEDNVLVLDGVVRSFPSIAPKCLRWSFPCFTLDDQLDPTDLRRPQKRAAKPKAEAAEPAPSPEPPWDARRFADAFVTAEPKSKAILIEDALAAGLAESVADRCLRAAIDREYVFSRNENGANTKLLFSTVKPEPANMEKTKAKTAVNRGKPRKKRRK